MKVPPEEEDGDQDEVKDDGEGDDDPCDDLPGVPGPGLVHGLRLLPRLLVLLVLLTIIIRVVIAVRDTHDSIFSSLYPNMIHLQHKDITVSRSHFSVSDITASVRPPATRETLLTPEHHSSLYSLHYAPVPCSLTGFGHHGSSDH